MEKKILYELPSLYRDNLRVTGFLFGQGEKSLCIVGSMRGNEYQQIYICSLLVKKLAKLEKEGRLAEGHQILIAPCVNPYSINTEKRFWPTDNTDINRMFPGYSLGETTQRIAGGVFDAVTGYRFGIQFTSFYMPGNFAPHVRIMKTGREYTVKAREFGLPYVVLRQPRPYDTATLNYNWQIWETDAFSVYSAATDRLDDASAEMAVEAVLNFMSREGMLLGKGYQGYVSQVLEDRELINVRAQKAGIFQRSARIGQRVLQGQELAWITDPYDGSLLEMITAPVTGVVFYVHDHPMTYANTAVLKLVPAEL